MLIRFYTARTFKAHNMTYPIRAFSRHLREIDINVKFHFKSDESLSDCDVLCISTEVLKKSPLNKKPPDMYAMLEHFRKKVDTIIWFDMSAGTGTTLFSVLPYVDLYAKNQLLKDRSLYTRQFYGNRIYSEYYHERFGIVDSYKVDSKSPAPSEALGKLAVSWNLGLGDYRTFSKMGRRLRIFWPFVNYHARTTTPKNNRNVDISYRVSSNYHLDTVSYQRQETRRRLEKMTGDNKYNIFYEGKLPYYQYKDEIRRAKVMPSPFGLGEICFRDFECFIAGAALFKPDMSHLETWPDYYQPDVTYVSHAWDFSDFQDQLLGLLESPEESRCIAKDGQDRLLHSHSDAGGEEFASHFAALIQKAVMNSSE